MQTVRGIRWRVNGIRNHKGDDNRSKMRKELRGEMKKAMGQAIRWEGKRRMDAGERLGQRKASRGQKS